MEVMATEEPCDIACRFGDGLLAIKDYPQGFPRPGKDSMLRLVFFSCTHIVSQLIGSYIYALVDLMLQPSIRIRSTTVLSYTYGI